MANLGVISALLQKGDHVFEDRLNHASLLDGGLLSQARLQRYQHADVADLAGKLERCRATQKLIASDGVFSMDGDHAPLSELIKIANNHDAWLMIDDAHGLGVAGHNGRGLLEVFNANVDDVPVLVGTLGKAMGTFGAFVAGDEVLIETLIQKARSYIFTTALPPAVAEATRASIKLVDSEAWRRDKLKDNIAHFRQCCTQGAVNLMASSSAIQPLIIGDVERTVHISKLLKQQGILLSAIRPPTVPEGTARLRVTLCAEHTHQQIEQLVDKLQQSLAA
jgi:8-amino-7-oxononanoate synthase